MSEAAHHKKPELTLSEETLHEATRARQRSGACEKVFSKYDRNQDGSVDTSELRAMCMEMGVWLSDGELRAAVHVLDTDGNGKIEFEEFARWWASSDRFERLRHSEAELAFLNGAFASFLSFDRDMDGTVDRREFEALHKVLADSGYRTHDIDADWAAMDRDRSGRICFSEYVDWLIAQASQATQQQPQQQSE